MNYCSAVVQFTMVRVAVIYDIGGCMLRMFVCRWRERISVVVVVDRFYIVDRYFPLWSAHCARKILHERIAFHSLFFENPPKWCTYSVDMAGAT